MSYTEKDLAHILCTNPDITTDYEAQSELAAQWPEMPDLDGGRDMFAQHPVSGVRRDLEHQIQAELFRMIDERAEIEYEWKYIYAVPNGGHRHASVGAKMKREGQRKGHPDIVWPLQMRRYAGLIIELKCGKNQPTPEQDEWLGWYASQGWFTAVIHDDAAKAYALLEWYWNGAR